MKTLIARTVFFLWILTLFTLGTTPVSPTLVLQAQANPCDRPALTGNHTVTAAAQTFYVCAPAADQVDGVRLYVNDVMTDIGLPTAGTANAAGKVPYPVPVTLSGKGQHKIETQTYVILSTGVKSPGGKSVPFVYVWEKSAPSTPTNHPAS